jgi:hypothetical protein
VTRPDLTRGFAALTVAEPLDPVERVLLSAWLAEALSEQLSLWKAPPCSEHLLCGVVSEGAEPDLVAALIAPSQASFYRARSEALERFSSLLEHPHQRALILAELLATRPQDVRGSFGQLAARVSYGELKRLWQKTQSASLLTLTVPAAPGPPQGVQPGAPGTSGGPKGPRSPTSASPQAVADQTAEDQPVVAIDRDSMSLAALVLWAIPRRLTAESVLSAIPKTAISGVVPEPISPEGSQFVGLRVAGGSSSALTSAVVELLQGSPTTAHAGAPRSEAPSGGRSSLDLRCEGAFLSPGPLQKPPVPAVVLTGVDKDEEGAVVEALRQLGPRVIAVEGSTVSELLP